MTIDEAIKHVEDVARQNEADAIVYSNCKKFTKNLCEMVVAENVEKNCCKCAEEHRQLAEWLKELKRLREQTDVPVTNVGDCISRQAAEQPEKRTEERTETHACDCISRQAAIDVVEKWFNKIQLNGDICCDGIRSLPSVEPERKTGKWIYTKNHCWICSECGKNPLKGTGFTPTLDGMRIQWKFCNMCGAKMEVYG